MADTIRVLLVDDEGTMLDVGKMYLEEGHEFTVETALSASAALELLKTKTYDAIVSDYQMPVMDGILFLKNVRALDTQIPFILLTGRGREEVAIEALNNGANFYLQKHGDADSLYTELIHVIRQVVRMRRAQLTLAEQEQRYHDLQNASDLIQSVGPDGRLLFANRRWLETLGYREEELPGLTVFDIIHEESLAHCQEIFRRVTSGENVGIIDAVFRKRDGTRVYVEGMASCRMAEGVCQYTRGLFRDVTDRKLAEQELHTKNEELSAAFEELAATEEELRHQYELLARKEEDLRAGEEKYRLLTEVTPDVIYMIDLQGMLIHVSPHIRRYGYLPDEVTGHHFSDFIAKEDRNTVLMEFQKAIANRTQAVTTIRILGKDGSIYWMEDNGAPVTDASGAVIGISGILRDVTERKKAEAALHESEELFRSIFENSPYPCAINSLPDNQFVAVNKAFLDISGYSSEEILGKDPIELGFLPLTEAMKLISHRILHGSILNVPLVVTAKGGRRIHVIFSTLTAAIQGRPALVTVTAEVTQLKRVEEELIRKNEDLNAAYTGLTATNEEIRHQLDELHKKEELIRASESKFRALVELSLDGILILDFSGRLLFANRAAAAIVDLEGYDALQDPRSVMDFVAPESRDAVLGDVARVAAGTDAYLVKYKLITTKNREVWVECIGKNIPYGDARAMLVSMRDISERQQAEARLRESETKFTTVFRSSPVALTLVSASNGTFVDVNDAFCRNTGYASGDVIGKTASDIGLFPDPREYDQFSSALRASRTVFGMEMQCRARNGEIHTCLFSSGIILMGGSPYILSTVEDITERKATQTALQAIVRGMVGTTGIGSLKKITETVGSWLPADLVMIGEILPDSGTVRVISLFPEGARETGFTFPLAGTPCGNVAERGFCLYPQNAGRIFPGSNALAGFPLEGYVGTPLRNTNGTVIGILCALSRTPFVPAPTIQETLEIIAVKAAAEIERIWLEREIRQGRKMLAEAMDLADLVHWEYDTEAGTFLFNDRFYALYGTTAEREGGYRMGPEQYIRNFVLPEDHTEVLEIIKKTLGTDDPAYQARIEHRIRRRDGAIRSIVVRIGIRKFENGRPVVIHGANQDITGRRQAEEALQQANKKLSLLSSITRHDIRNQLLVLNGFTAMLQKKNPDPEWSHFFTRIRDASSRIESLIQFTKEYEQLGVNTPVWQDVGKIAKMAAVDLVPEKVELVLGSEGCEIFADPMLMLVMFNLFDNALRHGGGVTRIAVSVTTEGETGTLSVQDNGTGIPADLKERIFERGFGKNTGLGLFLIREILSITGLTIRETGTEGQGARFEIHLPGGTWRRTRPGEGMQQ